VRLFVAVFPSDEARADLKRRLASATRAGDRRSRDTVRLTPADRWHITLRFLGEVADERQADVERALDGAAARETFALRLAGGGRFGKGSSTALWAGVDGDLAALADLHAGVRDALNAGGLTGDDRPLTPHLTVAYARDNGVLRTLVDYVGPQWTVDEFVLVRSRYADGGGGYQNLRSWPLR
jgi:2'-5' RNA ligase